MIPHFEQQILRSEQAKDVLDGVLKVAHAFGVWGLGFGVWGLGFGVCGSTVTLATGRGFCAHAGARVVGRL